MECTDETNLMPGSLSGVLAQPSISELVPTVIDRSRRLSSDAVSTTPDWQLVDTDDVKIASRHCVETLVAHQLGQSNRSVAPQAERDRLATCEREGATRFVLTQLYSHEKITVDLHLFDPTDAVEREQLQQYAKQLRSLSDAAIPDYIDAFELETPLGPGFAIVQAAPKARSIQSWMADGYCFDEFELMLIALRVLTSLKSLHGEASDSTNDLTRDLTRDLTERERIASVGCTLHRAIKPSNILLENRRVADPFADYDPTRDRRAKEKRDRGFGRLYLVNLERAAVENTSGTLTATGTYGYTAPEQFYGRAQPASDLYSLGATLIYMASGKSPATWMQSNLEIAPDNVALSRPFIEWISRLTHADLNQRTKSASSALQELEVIQLMGKPIAQGDYNLAVPRRQLSLTPQTAYLDFKVNSTPQELKIRFNYDRVNGDKSQRQSVSDAIISHEELKTALLLVVAVTIVGGTVALTGSALLGFVVALLLPAFYFLLVPSVPAAEPAERQANIRLRRDSLGRMFVTLATTPLPKRRRHGHARAQAAFLESQIHFANVPVRLLCTKPGLFSPKISFILATNDPKRTQKVAVVGSQEEIRWLRVHVGRWLKS